MTKSRQFSVSQPTAQIFVVRVLVLSVVVLCVSGCSVVRTTATVTGAAVSTTADVAKATVSTGAVVGGAAVTAASTAKSLSLATASVAIAGATLAGNMVMWGIALSKTDDAFVAPVHSAGGGRFMSHEGRTVLASECADVPVGAPALLAYVREGRTEVRLEGRRCTVSAVQ
jgi:hypothetical protein